MPTCCTPLRDKKNESLGNRPPPNIGQLYRSLVAVDFLVSIKACVDLFVPFAVSRKTTGRYVAEPCPN